MLALMLDDFPPGIRDYLGTERLEDPSATFNQRLGRCYELSASALVFGTAPKGSKLIHGSIHGPEAPRRISHAWLRLPGGRLWEPITAMIYDERAWTRYASAKVERVYTAREARRAIALARHYGRWHESRWP